MAGSGAEGRENTRKAWGLYQKPKKCFLKKSDGDIAKGPRS